MPMSSPPVAVGLYLCDYVIVEERTRKTSLIGGFTGLAVPRFPAIAKPFCVCAFLTDGLGSGTMKLSVTHLETDQEVAALEGPIEFHDRMAEMRALYRLEQFSVAAPGWYEFTLFVDGGWVAHRRIRVYERTGG